MRWICWVSVKNQIKIWDMVIVEKIRIHWLRISIIKFFWKLEFSKLGIFQWQFRNLSLFIFFYLSKSYCYEIFSAMLNACIVITALPKLNTQSTGVFTSTYLWVSLFLFNIVQDSSFPPCRWRCSSDFFVVEFHSQLFFNQYIISCLVSVPADSPTTGTFIADDG